MIKPASTKGIGSHQQPPGVDMARETSVLSGSYSVAAAGPTAIPVAVKAGGDTVSTTPVMGRQCETVKQSLSLKQKLATTVRNHTPDFIQRHAPGFVTKWLKSADSQQTKDPDSSTGIKTTAALINGAEDGHNTSRNSVVAHSGGSDTANNNAIAGTSSPPFLTPSQSPVGSLTGSESPMSDSGFVTPPEDVPLTCCGRIKSFFESCCLIFSLLCKAVMDCLYRWFCCCCITEDQGLNQIWERLAGFSRTRSQTGSGSTTPQSGAGSRQISDDEQQAIATAPAESPGAIKKRAWIQKKARYEAIIVDTYYEAFKPYSDSGLYRGLALNKNTVNTLINGVKPVMYEYIDNECEAIVEAREHLGEAIDNQIIKDIKNDIYSELLYQALKKLQMSRDRIAETYELFHEISKNKNRLEDKDNGDCFLTLYILGERRSDLPFGVCAYRKAIARIKEERDQADA